MSINDGKTLFARKNENCDFSPNPPIIRRLLPFCRWIMWGKNVLISNFHLIIISHLPMPLPWLHTHEDYTHSWEPDETEGEKTKANSLVLVVDSVKQRAHDCCANYWWNFNETSSKWKKASTTHWRVDFGVLFQLATKENDEVIIFKYISRRNVDEETRKTFREEENGKGENATNISCRQQSRSYPGLRWVVGWRRQKIATGKRRGEHTHTAAYERNGDRRKKEWAAKLM